MNEEQLKALRKSLNLPEGTPVDKVIETAQSAYQLSTSNATALQTANSEKSELEGKLTTATTELQTANGKVTTLEGEKAALTTEVSGLKTANTALAEGVATAFELAGKITPAQRDETIGKFTANGAKVTDLITELKNKKPEMNTKSVELEGKRIDISTANARQAAVSDLVAKRMKADDCDYTTAYGKVSTDPANAQLFAAMADPVREAQQKAA